MVLMNPCFPTLKCSMRLPSCGINAQWLRADDWPLHVPTQLRWSQMWTLQGWPTDQRRLRLWWYHQYHSSHSWNDHHWKWVVSLLWFKLSLWCHLSIPAGIRSFIHFKYRNNMLRPPVSKLALTNLDRSQIFSSGFDSLLPSMKLAFYCS